MEGQILSAHIILICRPQLPGLHFGPRDKWRTFQMTGGGQPQPVIPLIATHSSVAFLAGISPAAPHTVFWVCPHNSTHKHTLTVDTHSASHTLLVCICVEPKSWSLHPASFVCPQLFRPVACIVLPGSLPEALWPESSSLIGPKRDREKFFFCCSFCAHQGAFF